jgi:peptidyl-prolyl cis-trans isomerase D
LTDYLYTNPPADLRQNFTDEQGNFNVAGLQNMINQMKRSTKQEERDQLNMYLADLEYQRKMEKYNSILTNSVYYPKWYIEKQNGESALMAKVSYVSRKYSSISDSAVTVSDKEIEDYVSKHKELYKQDESRSIEYVLFDAAATAEDSAAIKQDLEKIKSDFAKDTLAARFLSGHGSASSYADQYLNKAQIQSAYVDSIIKTAKDSVYGPFLQDHYFVLAKMIDSKIMPDSVRARHILIPTTDPQTQKVILDDSTAKKKIDSIFLAIKNGARFDSLAKKYSSDGSAAKGGVLTNPQNSATEYFTQGQMVSEFNDFCFQGKKGEMKIVKTVFGYHLIEILDQKNPQPYYKIAFFSKNITASKETERKASEEASKFSNEAKDQKSFDAAIAKSNGKYKKLTAKNIKPNDISLQEIDRAYMPIIGFGKVISCRTLIKEIYKADKGDVLKQEKIGDPKIGNKQIVAIVTDVLKEGTQPAYIARVGTSQQSPSVENILKNQKKAEKIKQELGKVTTLEAVASSFKDSIVTIDSVRYSGTKDLTDPKVLGAIFNSSNKGKVTEPIAGTDAVYVLRVDDLTTTSLLNTDIQMQRAALTRQGKQIQAQNSPTMVIKKTATIRDNRKNFY